MLRAIWIIFIGVIICQSGWASRLGQPGNGNWIFHNPETNQYEPLVQNSLIRGSSLGFIINVREAVGKRIEICLEPGSSLFINNNLAGYFEDQDCRQLRADSLSKIYSGDNLFFTIYKPGLQTPDRLSYRLVEDSVKRQLLSGQREPIKVVSKSSSVFKDFFALGLVLILVLITLLNKFFPKLFGIYYNTRQTFSLKLSKQEAYKIFERNNLTFILFNSLLIAFLLITFASARKEWQDLLRVHNYESLASLIQGWALVTLFIFSFFIGKYLLIALGSKLFQLKDFRDNHFLDYVRISMVFFIFLFLALGLANLWADMVDPETLIWVSNLIIAFLVIRVVILFIKLLNTASFKKLHLISYLCGTEIFPLVIILKVFI